VSEAALAALLLYVTHPHTPPWRRGRSLAASFPAPLRIEIGAAVSEWEVGRQRDGAYLVSGEGSEYRFDIDEIAEHAIRVRSGGVMDNAKFLRDGDRLHVLHRGLTFSVFDLTLAAPETAAATGGDGKVRAALNGRVVAILVKAGDQVAAGQPVLTLEAMKMEHVHIAGIAGTIAAIAVAEGEQVTAGMIAIEIESSM
jgi:geranyl-CoA carboxylase alpha subunit